jgi:hypothetical protein
MPSENKIPEIIENIKARHVIAKYGEHYLLHIPPNMISP